MRAPKMPRPLRWDPAGRSVRATLLFAVLAVSTLISSNVQAEAWTVGNTGHVAALLDDGHILLTGGLEAFGEATTSAQVYVPDTQALNATGELIEPRAGHTATLLSDGRVLIAGGSDGVFTSDSLELFDPSNGTFAPVDASLLEPREGHIATSLSDGRVLFEGGWNDTGEVGTDEIYDPATETVSTASGLESLVFPTVATDKADYIPGETVTVTGSGWTPGETVSLLFDEAPLQHAPRVLTAIAGTDGTFANTSFQVEEHHAGTAFTLHATGSSSAWSAQTEFTDGSVLEIIDMRVIAPGTEAPSSHVGATDEIVSTGQTFTLQVTVRNRSIVGPAKPAFDSVAISLTLPTGWSTTGFASFNDLASDSTATKTCSVTAGSNAFDGNIQASVSGNPENGICGVGGIVCNGSASMAIESVPATQLTITSMTASPSLVPGAASVTVSTTVQNCSGCATAIGVVPGSLTLNATGSATATYVSGSAAQNIAGGSSHTFTRTYTASGNGTLSFIGSVSGIDENGGDAGSASQRIVSAGPASTGQVTVDSTAPTQSLPSNMTVEATGPSGRTLTFSATATDNLDPSVTPVCSPTSGSTFAIGTTTVNCLSTDDAGNSTSGSFAITVQDTTPPTISGMPQNQTLFASNGQNAVATWTAPTATDLVDGTIAISCSPTSGSTFPVGVSTVTCSAADSHSNSASATFSVTVERYWYQDADQDGFGNASATQTAASVPAGYVADATDCNDAAPDIYPGGTEACNLLDDDCDTQVDEGVVVTWYRDVDGDGFGDSAFSDEGGCNALEGYAANSTDCDDLNAERNPGELERCNDLDDDCNTATDDVCPLPPADPSDTAPPLDTTVATDMFSATEFLYVDDPNDQIDPLQTGMDASTHINADQVCVIRGRVLDRNGAALPNVEVRIAKYGSTESRAEDGMYDLVVNGGSTFVVEFSKDDYLPVQRRVVTWPGEYVAVPDVVLLHRDVSASHITLSEPMQAAVGSTTDDERGVRTAVVLFPDDVQPKLIGANGQKLKDQNNQDIVLSSFIVRATEYTIDGDTGRAAMPGELPTASAYTYAVDFHIDEAEAMGATSVVFEDDDENEYPVIAYVDNFLPAYQDGVQVAAGFRAGSIIPSGYYDAKKAAWEAAEDGRVVKIVGVTGGTPRLAIMKIDYTDPALDPYDLEPTDAADVLAFGITDEERERLAELYCDPQSAACEAGLWRMRIAHFSPWDFNVGYQLADDAYEDLPPTDNLDTVDDSCESVGSIIECQNQVLGERLAVPGTGMTLNYRSDRSAARNRKLLIPLALETIPESLVSVTVDVQVAGRLSDSVEYQPLDPEAEEPPEHVLTPDLVHEFEWDGRDAYGRPLQGAQTAVVRRTYRYLAAAATNIAEFNDSFPEGFDFAFHAGNGCGAPVVSLARMSASAETSESTPDDTPAELCTMVPAMVDVIHTEATTIGNPVDAQGLGGWTLDAVHTYDPRRQRLYNGDGSRRSASGLGKVVMTIAGGGQNTGDGGPATQASLATSTAIAADGDGNIYVAEYANQKIRKISKDGTISTVAGTGVGGWTGDGGAATAARISHPVGLAVDKLGNLYFSEGDNDVVRKVDTRGDISTIAGGVTTACNPGVSSIGDGCPATEAVLHDPVGLAADEFGNVYVADSLNHRVRQIEPGGTIRTIYNDEQPGDVEVDQAGNIYVLDRASVYRIAPGADPDDEPPRIAGTETNATGADGIPAASSALNTPTAISVGRDGLLYIAEIGADRVRAVNGDGIITTVAGVPGSESFDGDGLAATKTHFGTPSGLTFDLTGNLVVMDALNNRLRKLVYGFSIQDVSLMIPSEDGSVVYAFDGQYRHITTRDAVSWETLYTISYDGAGLLEQIAARYDNSIEIDRAAGQVTITGPFGEETTLALDGSGYLDTLSGRSNYFYDVTHTADGLLDDLTDPNGNLYDFHYDAYGRLTLDEDPAGGSKTLARTELGPNDFGVTVTTGMGRQAYYAADDSAPGVQERWSIGPDGTLSGSLLTDTSIELTSSLGMSITATREPDARFGESVPFVSSMNISTPGEGTTNDARSLTTTRTRSYVMDAQDADVIAEQTDTVTETDGDNNTRQSTTEYDATGTVPTVTTTTPEGRILTATLDGDGNLTKFSAPGMEDVDIAYDTRGRLSQVSQSLGARAAEWEYDSDGLLWKSKQWDGSRWLITTYTYDFTNHKVYEQLFDGRTITYDYDPAGNLVGVTPPERPQGVLVSQLEHTLDYTEVDLLERYVGPGRVLNAPVVEYDYNVDRQLELATLPNSDFIDPVYDFEYGTGQLTDIFVNYADSQRPDTQLSFDYDSRQRLWKVATDENTLVELGYDATLLTDITWSGAVAGTVHRAYDHHFRLEGLSVNGSTVAYAYDNDDVLTQAGALTRELLPSGQIDYDDLGDVHVDYSYTDFGEVASAAGSWDGDTKYTVAFEYDALGRVEVKEETVELPTTPATLETSTFRYTYDDSGRLTDVEKEDAQQVFQNISHYEYDDNGNRIEQTTPSGTATGTANGLDQLVEFAGVDYTFDENGYLQTRASSTDTTTYTYDALGNLRVVEVQGASGPPCVVEYLVDGFNRRIARTATDCVDLQTRPQRQYLYQDELHVVAELNGAGEVVSRFVYGGRGNVPEYMVQGTTTYRLLTDHLGSVRMVVDVATGNVAQRLDYDEFGRVVADSSPGFQPFGFAGGLYDWNTGLTRFGARDYLAETGQWTARDPILFAGGDANLYGYVLNDPVNWVDPSGEIAVVPILAGAAAGAAFDLASQVLASDDTWGCAIRNIDWGQVAGAALVGGALPFATAKAAGLAAKLGLRLTPFKPNHWLGLIYKDKQVFHIGRHSLPMPVLEQYVSRQVAGQIRKTPLVHVGIGNQHYPIGLWIDRSIRNMYLRYML